jgi:hypothetical protein
MSRFDSRRRFLKLPAAAAVSAAAAPADAPGLPQIRLGRHSISRLICGANPFNAGSHLSIFFNHELRRYYTPEQILKTLRRCQEVGINCWQSTSGNLDLHRRLLDEGGKMHFLSLETAESTRIADLARAGCLGVAHHGEFTDRLFKSGNIDKVRDSFERVRDAGMLVGVSTHMPAVIDTIESKGWPVDYYMACVYERHRTKEELEALLGQAPIPVGEVYLPLDPPRMFKMIQQTKRPCLAFKILAAGRLSARKEWVENAFRDTFASIKPIDAVIVGMYDRISDQPAENAAMVRRFSSLSGGRPS